MTLAAGLSQVMAGRGLFAGTAAWFGGGTGQIRV
jgi:hypothetical protein